MSAVRLSPRNDRKVSLMIPQQYDCLCFGIRCLEGKSTAAQEHRVKEPFLRKGEHRMEGAHFQSMDQYGFQASVGEI